MNNTARGKAQNWVCKLSNPMFYHFRNCLGINDELMLENELELKNDFKLEKEPDEP